MSQLGLFGVTVRVPIEEESIHGERRDGADHAPPPPRVVGHVTVPAAPPLPAAPFTDRETPWVICPARHSGSMDREHVELATWRDAAAIMARRERLAVHLYKIETDGAWTILDTVRPEAS